MPLLRGDLGVDHGLPTDVRKPALDALVRGPSEAEAAPVTDLVAGSLVGAVCLCALLHCIYLYGRAIETGTRILDELESIEDRLRRMESK